MCAKVVAAGGRRWVPDVEVVPVARWNIAEPLKRVDCTGTENTIEVGSSACSVAQTQKKSESSSNACRRGPQDSSLGLTVLEGSVS